MYNYLQSAKHIKNSNLCRYDSTNAYSTDFSINANVDGWDNYSNVYMYGCWNGILYGNIYTSDASITRTNIFAPISAEDFYVVRIMMKINSYKDHPNPTRAKIRWTTLNDSVWDNKKEFQFDLNGGDKWQLYILNLGPATYWQGNITNLKLYPCIDGKSGDQFAIQYIKIGSINKYSCSNTGCDYYLKYNHPCQGAGSKSYCESGSAKDIYSTEAGVNDTLIVNIDNYGNELIHLGTNKDVSGKDIARIISDELSKINIGGYAYSNVEYTEDKKLRIYSGENQKSFEKYEFDIDKNIGFIQVLAQTVNRSAVDGFELIIIEASPNVFFVYGKITDLVKLFYNKSSTVFASVNDILEYNNYFTNVEAVYGYTNLNLSIITGYDAHAGGGCNGRIVFNNETSISLAGGINDFYWGGSYYDNNYIKDVTNDYNILFNPHINEWTDPPISYYAKTKEILLYLNYGFGQVCCLYENTNAVSVTHGNCEIGNALTYDIIKSPFFVNDILSIDNSAYSVIINGGTAAKELGFYDENNQDISIKITGSKVATGFDYASSRRLKAFELNKLASTSNNVIAYTHTPEQYHVEAGRRDFIESSTANSSAKSFADIEYYKTLNNKRSTIIEMSHPINDSGILNVIYLNAEVEEGDDAKIYILRPRKNGTFLCVAELDFPYIYNSSIYTRRQVTYKIECNILVSKGDCLAIYNASPTVPYTVVNDKPNATYYQFSGKPDLNKVVAPGDAKAQGVSGFCIYARSNRRQTNVLLDVDLGDRVNIDSIDVIGRERNDYFEYNVASCIDLKWSVDLYSEKHTHALSDYYKNFTVYEHHDNIAYGIECLNDGITTTDNGRMGTGYGHDSSGLFTVGKPAYFYVNGDAEWLHNGANADWRVTDPKFEYSWPIVGARTYDYISDPISFVLIFPNEHELTVHKTIIYFKESKNFESFSLAYYLGRGGALGDDFVPNFMRIPKYNKIILDGITYDGNVRSTDFSAEYKLLDNVKDLLFNNPTKHIVPEFLGEDLVNWDIVQTAHRLDWNILGHEFDDVFCKGFNITTYYHTSTKITEMELYSKFKIDPSLSDNMSIIYSDYGENWKETYLLQDDLIPNKASAYVGNASRYFILEISSQTEFNLNNIIFNTSNSKLKIKDCADQVLLSGAKNNDYSDINKITIENVFDSPCDLVVDLPRERNSSNQLVSYMTMSSEDDILYPKIGPGGILNKNPNYLILNQNYKCAINTECYGLNDLAPGKDYYVMTNYYDWHYAGKLNEAGRFSFKNIVKLRETVLNIKPISDKYYKIVPIGGETFVSSIICSLNGAKVGIDSIVSELEVGKSYNSGDFCYSTSGENISKPLLTTNGNVVVLNWNVINEDQVDRYYIYNNLLILIPTSGVVPIQSIFNPVGDFKFDLDFFMGAVGSSIHPCMNTYIYFKDQQDNNIFYINFSDPWNGGSGIYGSFNLGGTFGTDSGLRMYNIKLERLGTNLSFKFNDNSVYNGSCVNTSIAKIVISFSNTNGLGYYGNEFYDYQVIGCPILNDNKALAFKLEDGAGLDKVILRTYNNEYSYNYIEAYDIYTSNDGVNFNKWDTAIIEKNRGSFEVFYAVDLGSRYILDIIRNYGDLINKLKVSTTYGLEYSRSDVSKIEDVFWEKLPPSMLLNFEEGFTDTMNKGRIINVYGNPFILEDNFKFGFKSLYFSGDGGGDRVEIPINNDQQILFNDGDFTIHYWEYRVTTGGDGYWGVGETAISCGGRAIALGVDNGYNKLMFNISNSNGFILYYNMDHTLNEWVHYAVTRKNNTYYLFRNGKLVHFVNNSQTPSVTGSSVWQLGYWYHYDNYSGRSYSYYFHGYLDEMVFIRGTALWTSDFTPPNKPYDVTKPVASKEDARWIKLEVINGDNITRNIDRLGVYPNVSYPYNHSGAYNCSWTSFGNKLSNYDQVSINVAEASTVSGSSYVSFDLGDYIFNWQPYNAVNGDNISYGYDKCWGFLSSDVLPTLEIDFGNVYNINRVVVYHGPFKGGQYKNEEFKLYYKNTFEDSYVLLLTVTGNNSDVSEHSFNTVSAGFFKIEITKYTPVAEDYIYSRDHKLVYKVDGGFIREIAVYTEVGGGEVLSEEWPIVCMNLRDQFNITGHALFNNHWYQPYGFYSKAYMVHTWDNSDDYFRYSDNDQDDPHKVAFLRKKTDNNIVYFVDNSEYKTTDKDELIVNYDVYLDVGLYDLVWEAYNPITNDLISLDFIKGGYKVSSFALSNIGSGWLVQNNILSVSEAGYFNLKCSIAVDEHETWGVRKISVSRKNDSSIKWLSLVRDTATGYSFNNVVGDQGIDYLDRIEVYGNKKYSPTEYWWWWKSTLCVLKNNYIFTKEGERSLHIDYPATDEMARVELIEADDFGLDESWFVRDLLCFWLYVDDITKLDINWGGFVFGSIYDDYGYYIWDIKNLNLNTGWNYIRLRFLDASFTNPVPNSEGVLDSKLNFRNRITKSFGMTFRGIGESFFMCIDGLKIERATFEDNVRFGKGLCLSWDEYLEIPIADVSPKKGSVEFWAKLYCDNTGKDVFGDSGSRNFFSIVSNNNDIVSLGIRSFSWFEAGVGGAKKNYYAIVLTDENYLDPKYFINREDVVHIGLVWSNDGADMSGGETLRLYINGDLVIRSNQQWQVGDAKSTILRLGGGASVLAYNNDIDGSAIFNNLKVYNYCVDSFDINNEDIVIDNYITPNHFLTISRDGENFYGIDSGELPFVYQQIQPGEKVDIYLRSVKDRRIKITKKTAQLEVGWLKPV